MTKANDTPSWTSFADGVESHQTGIKWSLLCASYWEQRNRSELANYYRQWAQLYRERLETLYP